ncbi:hypothetical protein AGLY_005881 [Aphis glycines]|uniref:Uncharacterized protein n=1 Tax=Aphis glycines TaxID=307491 RepID=A0A6G0TTF9_APHGL|nr:hypothetical protein AGLY_005881 [Aphis glycines]
MPEIQNDSSATKIKRLPKYAKDQTSNGQQLSGTKRPILIIAVDEKRGQRLGLGRGATPCNPVATGLREHVYKNTDNTVNSLMITQISIWLCILSPYFTVRVEVKIHSNIQKITVELLSKKMIQSHVLSPSYKIYYVNVSLGHHKEYSCQLLLLYCPDIQFVIQEFLTHNYKDGNPRLFLWPTCIMQLIFIPNRSSRFKNSLSLFYGVRQLLVFAWLLLSKTTTFDL